MPTAEELTKKESARNAKYRLTHKQKNYKREKNAMKEKQFCAWDGEGVTNKDGIHEYCLLANSHGNDILKDKTGLSTEECFDFLIDEAKLRPGYVHVIFYGSYDACMMFHDMPRSTLKRLHETGRCLWRHYNIHYMPHKCLEIYRRQKDVRFMAPGNKSTGFIKLWDVHGFFQSTFVHALETFFTPDELVMFDIDRIVQGKAARHDFQNIDSDVRTYCHLEVKALARLMNRLYNEYCIPLGIPLSRFDGAGAAAASVLKREHVKDHFGKALNILPQELNDASQYAFFGGNIQLFKYGHYDGDIFHVDVNSGYPNELAKLPSLKDAEWIHHDRHDINLISTFSVYHVKWDYTKSPYSFFPFPWRDTDGSIYFPTKGEGWYWKPEIEAAIKWNLELNGRIEFIEQWECDIMNFDKPFAFIYDMYKSRQKHKAEGNGIEKVEKLTLNSLYGKTVQHLGWDEEKPEKLPPFFNIIYGGNVTSGLRAKMFDAAMQQPDSVIAIATDGLWSTKKLDLDYGKGLGQWDFELQHSATFVQAGVYWTHKFSQKDGNCPYHLYCEQTSHYRGFDKGTLKEEDVLLSWAKKGPVLLATSTRFVTLGLGLALKDFRKFANWETVVRSLSLWPSTADGKRNRKRSELMAFPESGLEDTIPGYEGDRAAARCISTMYNLPWNEGQTTAMHKSRTTTLMEDDAHAESLEI